MRELPEDLGGIQESTSRRRREISRKLAEKRFRAFLVSSRDVITFYFAVFGFGSVAVMSLLAGRSMELVVFFSSNLAAKHGCPG